MADDKPDNSIRASLARGFEEAAKAASEAPDEPVTETVADTKPAAETDTTDEGRDAGGQPRDEHGRFAPKAAAEQPAEAPAAEAPEEAASPVEAEEPPEPAPHSWKAEDKAHWDKIPKEVRAVIARREAERDRHLNEVSSRLAPLTQVVEHYQPYLVSLGMTPEYAFATLLNAERTLRTGDAKQRAMAIAALAQQYSVDLGQIAGAPAGQAPHQEEFVDPQVQHLRGELEAMKMREHSRLQHEQASRYRSTVEQITAFAEAKDGSGNPAHPFFDQVKDDMARLAAVDQAQGRTPELASLYERAVWSNPAVRNDMLAAQRRAEAEKAKADAAARAAKAEAEKKAKAQAARLAAVSVAGAPTNGSVKAPDRSVRESLEAGLRRATARL